jgi:predicted Rossmann-fold nucleotide-binding protein
MKKIISVCGSDLDDEHLSGYALKVAEQVGRLVAQNDFVLLCGGHGGIMGNIRNFLVANSGDVVIAIGGRWGTLNEISFSMIYKKPLILIKGTGGCVDEIINGCIMQNIESEYYVVNSAEEAINKAVEILSR